MQPPTTVNPHRTAADILRVADNWRPTRDFVFVRELPVEQTGLIIPPIDPNRSSDLSPILTGIVEAVGPKVTELQPGDFVYYEIHAGEFRIPGDDMVRIIYEHDILGVSDAAAT